MGVQGHIRWEYATHEVPHITQLDAELRQRLRGKQTAPANYPVLQRSYTNAWRWYIRGNVVSRHAQRLIVQFMAVNCGRSQRDNDKMDEAEENLGSAPLPDSNVALDRVHAILDRMSFKAQGNIGASVADVAENVEDDVDAKALQQTVQINESMKLTAKLWSRDTTPWDTGNVNIDTSTLSGPATPSKTSSSKKQRQRCNAKAKQSFAYIHWKEADVTQWLNALTTGPRPPTSEQLQFLMAVVERCKQEAAKFKRGTALF